MRRILSLPIALVALLAAAPLTAQERDTPLPGEPGWDDPFVQVLSPGTEYDPSVPTLREVAGHDFHQEVTPPDEIAEYMRALAEAAPDRTHLIE